MRTRHSYCFVGGMEHVTGGSRLGKMADQPLVYLHMQHELESAAKELYDYTALMTINDEYGYEAVMTIINKAIENRKSGINHLDFPVLIGDAMKDVESADHPQLTVV